jgi:hypothetical protein
MTTTEIREALSAIEQGVDVPPVDQVAFQARVRAERRRRTAGRTLVGVAAAAAVVTTGVAVNAIVDEPQSSPVTGPAGPSTEPRGLADTVFFMRDGRLAALEPDGDLHDVGVPSEGAVGWTDQRVYAVDAESGVVVFRVRDTGDDLTFSPESSPVSGPVQRVEMSGDRRFLAWMDNDNVVHRYDLDAGAEDLQLQATSDDWLSAVSEEGVLLAGRGALVLRAAGSSRAIPAYGGPATSAQLANGLVLVNDDDGRARLYDVREGAPQLVAALPGSGVLGPRGERVATIVQDKADRAHVEMWDGRAIGPVTGLEGVVPIELRWADETTLLVSGWSDGEQGLYACDIDLLCGPLQVNGDLRLHA